MELIIIRGPAGSGKTTVAKELAERLTAYRISLDEELTKRGLDTVVNGSIPFENFRQTIEALLPELRRHETVILEGCFYYDDLFILLAPFKPAIFTLDTPLDTCIERDAQRENPLGEAAIREVWKLVKPKGTMIDATGTAAEIASIVSESRSPSNGPTHQRN